MRDPIRTKTTGKRMMPKPFQLSKIAPKKISKRAAISIKVGLAGR
jgi:hypothetical protein